MSTNILTIYDRADALATPEARRLAALAVRICHQHPRPNKALRSIDKRLRRALRAALEVHHARG